MLAYMPPAIPLNCIKSVLKRMVILFSAEPAQFNMCVKHEKVLFAQKEVGLRGTPHRSRYCDKNSEDCFVVSALSSKYEDRRVVVPESFPGPFHFIAQGCTRKNRCESMCDDLNITSPMRGSIFSCNVTCCNTSYCTGMCYV